MYLHILIGSRFPTCLVERLYEITEISLNGIDDGRDGDSGDSSGDGNGGGDCG